MASVFTCSACNKTIAAEAAVGTAVRCPLCGAVVQVPATDGSKPATDGFTQATDAAPPTGMPPAPPAIGATPPTSAQDPIRPGNARFQTEPISSGMAIGALVCGILGIVTCVFPIGIVGIILGIIALNRASGQPQRYGGKGLAIGGIVVGGCSLVSTPMLIAMLLPSLGRARELSKQTVCMANLRGLGQACYIYAQDPPGVFPMLGGVREENDGAFTAFDPQVRANGPWGTGVQSPSADMWALVIDGYSTPKQFICPSTTDAMDQTTNVQAYYDFKSPNSLSYSYQYQHDPDRRPIGTMSEPTFPVMADANPYTKGGVQTPFSTDRASTDDRGNSTNHTKREGQNVLWQDGHVSFEKGPDVGLSGKVAASLKISRGRDNCYTTNTLEGPVDPGNAAPSLVGTKGTCNLGGKSDACLVP